MKLKRTLLLLLMLLISMSVVCSASAEENSSRKAPDLEIPSLEAATDEELEAARQMILLEQRARIRAYIALDQTEITAAIGTVSQLKAEVKDLLEDLTSSPFEWSSSNESIATVTKNGQVKAVSSGEAEITCAAEVSDGTELKAVCKVKVYVPVTGISAENKGLKITKGQTQKIIPVVLPTDATDPSVTFESSDEEIAKVSVDGTVTAVSPGTFSITITAEDGSGKSFRLKGNVLQDVEEIRLEKDEISIPAGKSASLKTEILPVNAALKKVIWTVEDESVATINANGQITAVAAGTTIVRAEAEDGNGAKAECKVIVVNPVQSITLSEKALNLVVTVDVQLTAEVLPETATNRKILWSSSNEAVATVDQSGKVTPKAKGTCVITAESVDGSGVKAQVKAAVKAYDVVFTSSKPITVTYDTFDMSAGMFTMDWKSKYKRIHINGDRGSLQLTPLAEGEDIVSVTEREYFSRKKISKKWTVYVMPGALDN